MLASLLKKHTSEGKDLKLARPEGGRAMSVTVGPRKEQEPLTAEDIRELEMMLNLSRRKREALGHWLRRKKVPMDARIREQLITMDGYLEDWYEVAMVDCEEKYEVKGAGAKGQEEQEKEHLDKGKEGEVPAPEPAPASAPEPVPVARRRGQGVVRGRGGRAQGQLFVEPLQPCLATTQPGSSSSRVRVRRGAALEANRTLDESYDRGEIVEEAKKKKSRKKLEHEQQKVIRQAGKKRPAIKKKKKKKKAKIMKSRIVQKELVYVKDVAAFLEMVRLERSIAPEDAMVRLAIDAGQGSLKVVANLFNRYVQKHLQSPGFN